MQRPSTRKPGEHGVVIIWVALFLLLVLGFIALGIDLSKLMATRSQLQNAADAAALAGASAIDPATGVIVATQAVARAQQTASHNEAFVDKAQPVSVNASDVVVGSGTCKVTVRREGDQSIVTYFANVLGIPSLQMTATATAKVDTAHSVTCGVVPLAMAALPGQNLEVGQVYQLKLPGGSGAGGNYNSLNFPADCAASGPCAGMGATGAKVYKCWLEHGYCCEIQVGQSLSTQTGNMAGPNREAVQYLFGQDAVDIQNITYEQYQALGGTGQRVVTVAIASSVQSPSVTISGFATFFIRNIPGSGTDSHIDGEFLYATVPGTGDGNATNGVAAFALRLIR